MKKGIIVIFGKNDIDVLKTGTFNLFYNKQFQICFVNNGNDNKVLNSLIKLKESSKFDISILNLRKEKGVQQAIKAGVRFISNLENVNLIVHSTPKSIFNKKLMAKLVEISEENLGIKKDERVLLRKVYSLDEILSC
jgi:hypothetical protein